MCVYYRNRIIICTYVDFKYQNNMQCEDADQDL